MSRHHPRATPLALTVTLLLAAALGASAQEDPWSEAPQDGERVRSRELEGTPGPGPLQPPAGDELKEEDEEVPYREITVLSPDGTALDGVSVLVTRRNAALFLEGNVPVPSPDFIAFETAEGGTVTIPLLPDGGQVVALHDAGYAEAPLAKVFEAGVLGMQAYGRVKGTVRVGSKPGANLDILLSYDVIPPRGEGRAHPSYRTKSDGDGHFGFEKAPAGMGRVAIEYISPWGQRQWSHARPVDIEAGETVATALGGTGRPVTGRILAPDDAPPQQPWAVEKATILPVERVTVADAKRDLAKYRNRQAYYVATQPDGTFRAEDVEAGEYRLTVQIREAIDGAPASGRLMGKLEHVFAVPEIPGGRDDEPVDVGELAFESVRIVDKAWR